MAINYAGMLAQLDLSPLSQELRAQREFKLQSEYRDMQRERMNQEAAQSGEAQRRQAAFRAAYSDAIQNPSQIKFDSLRANYPEETQAIDSGWKSYSGAQQRDMLSASAKVIAALSSGNPQLAVKVLDDRISALDRTNVSSKESRDIRSLIASGDPAQIRAARGLAGVVLAQATGDDFDRVWTSLNRDQREEELQPDKMRAAEADADYKETRARYAPSQEKATLAGKDARTTRSRQLTKFAAGEGGPAGNSTLRPGKRRATSPAPSSGGRTATGPNGEKLILREGKWVRVK